MARTPLLRSLKQLLNDYRNAQQQGLSLEAFRKIKRNRRGINRREFLIGSSTLAASAALSTPAWADREGMSIAIIGGGMAGLTCALTLADRGIRSTVYEASHRVGGRMFSNRKSWADDQVSEWCGELIDTGHKTMRRLARRFNLPLDDLLAAQADGAEDTFYFFGQHYLYAQAEQDFYAVAAAIDKDLNAAGYPTRYDNYTADGYRLDNTSIYDWINQRIPGGHDSSFGQLLDVAYNIEYGAESNDQSALNLLYLLGYQANPNSFTILGESDERFHIRGGNDQLPTAIANYLGDQTVRLGHRLLRIRKTASQRYQLAFSTDSGKTVETTADAVVMALPFSVLREIDYHEADFRPRKHKAIQNLGRGRNGKLQLQFDKRIWRNAGAWPGVSSGSSYSDTGFQAGWEVSRGQVGDSGIIVFYSGGDVTSSMATQRPFAGANHPPVLTDAANVLTQAEPVFPGLTAQWNGRVTQSIPHLSPLFRSSYAYYRVGQYTDFAGIEGENEGRVYFCGEHTSQDFQGYMEGAASEGARIGKEIARIAK